MMKYGTVDFTGASGMVYQFTAYDRDTQFKAVGAVYFITKRSANSNGGYSHFRVYIGETGDLSDRPLNHHRTDCFDDNEANCVCIFTESDSQNRLNIETDLRENYDTPCNRQ